MPNPGIAKILSIKKEPVIDIATLIGKVVMIGINEFLKTCFLIICDSDKPFDCAVNM